MNSKCAYCGVGCGIEVESEKLRGSKSHPTNHGELCMKGATLLETRKMEHRLETPLFRTDIGDSFREIGWDQAIDLLSGTVSSIPPDRQAYYLSGQLLTEDYYVANKFVKGFVGTNNVDTNSRTCMSSAVVAYKKSLGADYVPVTMEDVYHADLLFIIGGNPAEAHPILFNHIKKAKKDGLKIVVVDPRKTMTASYADLFLPIQVGGDIDLLNSLSKELILRGRIDPVFISEWTNGYEPYKERILGIDTSQAIREAGISEHGFEELVQLFTHSRNIVSMWTMGLNQSVQGVDKILSLINLHLVTGTIGKPGNGPFSLTGQPNAMGGREVGGLATMIAVHLDFDPESVRKVSAFWGTTRIQGKKGLTATEIFDSALQGKIDFLMVLNTDPVYHLPNRHRIEEAIQKIPLVVDVNAYRFSQTSSFAHLLLPAAPWGEKEGVQTNMDRIITKVDKLFPAREQSKQEWEIFCLIARKLGWQGFGYQKSQDIFDEYKEMTRLSPDGHLDISDLSYERLEKEPFRWGKHLLDKGGFFTKDKKANILFSENRHLSEKTSEEYPFILMTGRTRDLWHSGIITSKIERLQKFKKESFVELNPEDAETFGIGEGDPVVVSTKRGAISVPATLSPEIRKGILFIPVTDKRINYLTNDLVDPSSLQPDYNHNAARIRRADQWEQKALSDSGESLSLNAGTKTAHVRNQALSDSLSKKESPS
ncbi:MAG: molybdopterin oxidoreductase family protein [Leptospirales bacterium]